jgi:hypothetical protein
MNDFSRVSRVHGHLLFLFAIILAAALPAGCSPSPRVIMEEYLEGKQAVETSTLGITMVEISSCPEALSGWLDEGLVTSRSWLNNGDIHLLATYAVDGNSLTLLEIPIVPEKYETWQQDEALHQQTWNHITEIIPAAYRDSVTRFVLFSDGPASALGAVEQTSQPGEWTIIHETAHLLSLDTTQVETYLPLFEHPQNATLYEEGEAACGTYFIPEGCSLPDSYLNLFFEQFWTGIYVEWKDIQLVDEVDARQDLLTGLHDRHVDEFVSSYAVTSPEEDLAESFLYFVLSPESAGERVAEEKMRFFQQFPDLVNLRQQMRTNLCTIWEP